MLINQSAGRVYGSDKYAPVIPWVTDFSNLGDFYSNHHRYNNNTSSAAWRDLTKSKFRLIVQIQISDLYVRFIFH